MAGTISFVTLSRWQKSRLTGKLAEQGETHSNGTDLSWEDLRHVEVHGGVAAGAISGLANIDWLGLDMTASTHPWNARYRYIMRMPTAFPPLFEVPAYSAVIAARIEVVMMIPTKPVMYMPRRELTLSCSQAPRGL